MNRRNFLSLALAGAATAAASSTALAGNYGYKRVRRWRVVDVYSYDWLNIRSGPSTRWSVIGRLAHNETGIRVIKWSRSRRWAKIVGPYGETGWVSARYIRPYWA